MPKGLDAHEACAVDGAEGLAEIAKNMGIVNWSGSGSLELPPEEIASNKKNRDFLVSLAQDAREKAGDGEGRRVGTDDLTSTLLAPEYEEDEMDENEDIDGNGHGHGGKDEDGETRSRGGECFEAEL